METIDNGRDGAHADRLQTTAAGLLFAVAAGATFSLVLIGRPLYFGDFQAAFEPLRGIVGRAWREGLPVWSPALSNGMPLLASPFVGVLYPPNLAFALSTSHVARVLSVLVVLHVFFGGWGAARLARRLGCSPAGAAATALAFALSGATVSGTYMVVLVCTAMWLPWLLLALSGIREGRGEAGVALGVALGLMLLAGDPVMILAGTIGGACLLAGSKSSLLEGKKLVVGLALSVALAAPSLLALWQYFPSTARSRGYSANERLSHSLHPLETIGLIVPDAFGSRVLGGPEGILFPGQAEGNGSPLFPGLYAGALAFALAGVGVVRSPLRWRLLVWLLLLVFLALGRYGPIAVASDLPGFVALRYPSKWILAATLPFALFVGSGVSALERTGTPKDSRLFSGLLACALITLAAIGASTNLGLVRQVAESCSPSGSEGHVQQIVEVIRNRVLEGAARGALPAVAALGIVRFAGGSGGVSWLLSLILALDLASANRSLAPTAPARFYESRPAAIRAIEGDPAGHERVWVDQSAAARAVPSRTPPDLALDEALPRRRERLDGYTVVSYGLPLAFPLDLEGLVTSRYALLTNFVYSVPRRTQVTLLAAGGVSHLVSPMALVDDRLEEIASLDVGADQALRVYRNRAVLPRARLVKVVVPVRADQYSQLFAGLGDNFFASRTIVEEGDLSAVTAAWRASGADSSAGEARLIADAATHVVVRTTGGGGFLVLTDCFAPGWRARVDGRPATIFPADVAFRMIVVPQGTHDVAFDYSPWRP